MGMDFTEVMMAIEDCYGLKLDEGPDVKTFGDLVDHIQALITTRGGRHAPGGWFQRLLLRDMQTAIWRWHGGTIRPSTPWNSLTSPAHSQYAWTTHLRSWLHRRWHPATDGIRILGKAPLTHTRQQAVGDTIRCMLLTNGALAQCVTCRAETRTILAWILEDQGADHHTRITEHRNLVADLLV